MSKDKDCDSVFSASEIAEVVKRDLENEEFEIIEYQVKPFSDNPMGFLGVHYKIIVTYEIAGERNTKSYFSKKIPEDIPSHHFYAIKTNAFFKEIEFYEKLVKDVERNMTPGRKLNKWCPKFLYARPGNIFVVEDLCAQGFYMYPEREELFFDHVKLTLQTMAAMHAGPMILEQLLRDGKVREFPQGWSPGDGKTLKDLYKQMVFESECTSEKGHPGNTFFEAGFKSQNAIVDLLPNYTPEQKTKIKSQLTDILRRIFLFVHPSDKYRNTWVHGDLWANNVMFRNDEAGIVKEAVIFDFQLARLCPPAHDVVMFIHLVQSRSFREKHQNDLLNIYYEALSNELEAEGYSIEEILPRDEFDESCKYYDEFSLLSQVMYYQLILSPPSITSKFLSSPDLFDLNMLTDRTEMVVETYKTDELCRNRITEAMDELIQFYKLV